jgi:hypothetical protein
MLPSQQDQVRPAQLVAVFLLHRPQEAPRLVEVAVVGPRIQRRETDVAMPAAATAVGKAVGPGGVPRQADHQSAVMPVIGWPPVLVFGHQGLHVGLHGLEVERLHRLAIVEIAKRVRLRVVLVKDVEVERLGPPMRDLVALRRQRAVHHGASTRRSVVAVHHVVSPLLG